MLASLVMVLSVESAFAEAAYVQVRATKVRSQPKIWASSIQEISYGDRVDSLETVQGWAQVATLTGKKGFVPQSALTAKKVLKGSSTVGVVENDDIVLAGKGFNRELEKSLRSAESSLDYRAVDDMEKLRVSSEELRTFIQTGMLKD